jgi:F0F1-type ATP synthase assembly protein I
VLVYGLVGWALDRWLDTSFLVVVGILVGAVLGTYMTWKRFNAPWSTPRKDAP